VGRDRCDPPPRSPQRPRKRVTRPNAEQTSQTRCCGHQDGIARVRQAGIVSFREIALVSRSTADMRPSMSWIPSLLWLAFAVRARRKLVSEPQFAVRVAVAVLATLALQWRGVALLAWLQRRWVAPAHGALAATTQQVQARVRHALDARVGTAVDAVAVAFERRLVDPDMPAVVREFLRDTVRRLMPEVKRAAADHAARVLFTPLQQQLRLPAWKRPSAAGGDGAGAGEVAVSPQLLLSDGAPRGWQQRVRLVWRRWRAFVLHTTSPYDASFWAVARRPSYWYLTLAGMVPVQVMAWAWWMMMFAMRDTSDEYQLCDFVVSFQVAKFASLGVWGVLQGGLRYFVCDNFPATWPCPQYKPQCTVADAAFTALQVALVMRAYGELLLVHKRGSQARHVSGAPAPVGAVQPHPSRAALRWWHGADHYRDQGGVLQSMVWFHVAVIVTCLVAGHCGAGVGCITRPSSHCATGCGADAVRIVLDTHRVRLGLRALPAPETPAGHAPVRVQSRYRV